MQSAKFQESECSLHTAGLLGIILDQTKNMRIEADRNTESTNLTHLTKNLSTKLKGGYFFVRILSMDSVTK